MARLRPQYGRFGSLIPVVLSILEKAMPIKGESK
jgi:hypothetical protein